MVRSDGWNLGEGDAVVAAHHPAGAPQFAAVVATHRVLHLGIEAVDAQAIAPMLTARAVQVAAPPQVEPHVGAALRPPEEDQIAGPQQAIAAGPHRHGLAEALLLVGIARDPHTNGGKGGLGEAGTVVVRPEAAAPQVVVGPLLRLIRKGEQRWNPRCDGGGIEQAGGGPARGDGDAQQSGGVDPAGIAILQQPHPQPPAASGITLQQLQNPPGRRLGGQARAAWPAVEIQASPQAPETAWMQQLQRRGSAWGQAA